MRVFIANSYRQLRRQFDRIRFDYWTSIDFLPVMNFFLVIEKEDARYLLKRKDYEKLPICYLDLSEIWEQIMEQYYEEEGNNAITVYFNNYKALHKLELEYQVVWNLWNIITIEPENEEALELGKQYKIKTAKEAEKKLKGIKNQIELKQKQIEEFNIEDEKKSFDEIIDMVQDQKGRNIDAWSISVKRWIAIKNNLIKRQKEQKRKQANGNR